MKLQFYLRFHTQVGQSLWISGNTEELGNQEPARAVPMEFLNEEFWQFSLELKIIHRVNITHYYRKIG